MTRPSETLKGHTVGTGWNVVEAVPRYPGQTGSNFSVGYFVEKPGVGKAFMKALDYSRAFSSPNTALALQELTSIVLFERELLELCKARKLSKIVRLIESGTYDLPGTVNPIMGKTEFFIFELAVGDIRKAVNAGFSDVIWNLCVLHQTAIALGQLHGTGIAHQDIKPSNILTMKHADKSSQVQIKVADVGTSSVKGRPGPYDGVKFAGDPSYGPPEAYYGHTLVDWVDHREATDCFMLGSVISYLFAGIGMTQALFSELNDIHFPQKWKSSYPDLLPILIDAHDKAIEKITPGFPECVRSDLVATLRELTHPDPLRRGHPRLRVKSGGSIGIDRYVSRFDLLAKRAAVSNR